MFSVSFNNRYSDRGTEWMAVNAVLLGLFGMKKVSLMMRDALLHAETFEEAWHSLSTTTSALAYFTLTGEH